MSGPDAIHSEMPGFPFPGRPGGEHDEPLLDMIIARRALPPDAPQEMHDLARMLAALAGPGEPGELAPVGSAGWPQASWPERRQRWLPSCDGPLRPASRPRPAGRCGATAGPAGRAALASSRAGLAAAMVAAAAMLGVLAAYAGVLPTVPSSSSPTTRSRRRRPGTPARSCPRRRDHRWPEPEPVWPARPASRPRSRTSRPDPPRRPASRERPGPGRRRRKDPFPVPPARAACRARGRPSSPGRGYPLIPPRRPGGRRYAAAPVRSARPGPCPAWSPTSHRDRAS